MLETEADRSVVLHFGLLRFKVYGFGTIEFRAQQVSAVFRF
jgi:hypothetical protein